MQPAATMIKGFEIGGLTPQKILTVFWETAGKKDVLTVGYGHKVLPGDKIWVDGVYRTLKKGDVITQKMADDWYKQDLAIAKKDAETLAEKWNIGTQPPKVTNILTQMAFQMGLDKVGKFKNMFGALKAGKHQAAANEMLVGSDGISDSLWVTQTPKRAKALAAMMQTTYK